jgi:hypothetical protein
MIEKENNYKITTTQVGSLAESIVANNFIIFSNGRLTPFKPIADDVGIDILIFDKITGLAIPIQVKSRRNTLYKRGTQDRGNLVAFNIRKATLNLKHETILLCVLISDNPLAIEMAWMLTAEKMVKVANNKKSVYTIIANKQVGSKDKFKEFQYHDFSKVVEKVKKYFDCMDKISKQLRKQHKLEKCYNDF